MIALERDGSVIFQGLWTRSLQSMVGLIGNNQPELPHATAYGTLRNVEFSFSMLDKYQKNGAETGKIDSDVWRISVAAKDISLTQAKKSANDEVSQKRFDVETGGIIGDGKFYATDRHSQAAIFRASGTTSWKAASTVSRDIDQPDGSSTTTVCISGVEFVDTDMPALQSLVKTHIKNAYARESALLTAINNADNLAALRSIDLTSGWAAIPRTDPGE